MTARQAFAELAHAYSDLSDKVDTASGEESADAFHQHVKPEGTCRQPSRCWKVACDMYDDEMYDETSLSRVSDNRNAFSAMAKKRALEIKEEKCTPEEQRALEAAKRKEFAAWMSNNVTELVASRGAPIHRVIRARWLLKLKIAEENAPEEDVNQLGARNVRDCRKLTANARLIPLGNEDPDLGHNAPYAPTLRCSSRHVILHIIVKRGYYLLSPDARRAFLQGRNSRCKLPACILLPHDSRASLVANGPVKLLKAASGLSEAPYELLVVFVDVLEKCGCVRVSFDTCVFGLPGNVSRS